MNAFIELIRLIGCLNIGFGVVALFVGAAFGDPRQFIAGTFFIFFGKVACPWMVRRLDGYLPAVRGQDIMAMMVDPPLFMRARFKLFGRLCTYNGRRGIELGGTFWLFNDQRGSRK